MLERARPPGRRVLRFYGASESAVAKALADAGGDGDGVEATICARDFEIHVDLLVEPGAEERAEALERALVEPLERYLFARDERPVEELVLDLCRARGWSLGDGRVVHRRARRGAADLGAGIERRRSPAASSPTPNAVKEAELGVPAATLAEHGAVSAETAAAMAAGVRARLGVDVGVAVTGIAGPGGGTPEKPVGLVYLHAETPDGEPRRRVQLPVRPRDGPARGDGRRAPPDAAPSVTGA